VFGKEGCDILVIQQRSPVLLVRLSAMSHFGLPPLNRVFLQPRKQEFIDALLQFLQESRLSATLFLSGVDMSNRTDAQMMFVTSKSFARFRWCL
jgi:proteasome assembly chaperone 2